MSNSLSPFKAYGNVNRGSVGTGNPSPSTHSNIDNLSKRLFFNENGSASKKLESKTVPIGESGEGREETQQQQPLRKENMFFQGMQCPIKVRNEKANNENIVLFCFRIDELDPGKEAALDIMKETVVAGKQTKLMGTIFGNLEPSITLGALKHINQKYSIRKQKAMASVSLGSIRRLSGNAWLNDEILGLFFTFIQVAGVCNSSEKGEDYREDCICVPLFYSAALVAQQKEADLNTEKGNSVPGSVTKPFLLTGIKQANFIVFILNTGASHWSTWVVVNPGKLLEPPPPPQNESTSNATTCNASQSCILVLDSMRSISYPNDEMYGTMIRTWLNNCTQSTQFTAASLPIVTAQVPQQGNGSDCGLCCLRFASEIVKRGSKPLMPSDWSTKLPLASANSNVFVKTISDAGFELGEKDLREDRNELGLFISRLVEIWWPPKRKKKRSANGDGARQRSKTNEN